MNITTLSAGVILLLTTAAVSPAAATGSSSCTVQAAQSSRIAVAGGSVTEIIFALGAEDRIVGVDRTSNYPPAALELPQIGYVRNLSTEGLLSLRPTLVMGEHDMGPPEVVNQMDRVGVAMVTVPEAFSFDGIVDKVRCVGSVLGLEQQAQQIINERLEPLRAAIATQTVSSDRPKGLVLLGLREGAPIAAGQDTSGDGLLAMAGLTNVMTDFEGWKPVSIESMALAAPEVIVIPERGISAAGGMDQLLNHPALRHTPAAANHRVVSMDGMAMLGFGLRTVDAAIELRAQTNGTSSRADTAQVPSAKRYTH